MDIKGEKTPAAPHPDPALDPANQHHHEHIHHADRVAHANDNVTYYKEPSTHDPIDNSNLHYRAHAPDRTSSSDIEKGEVEKGKDVKYHNAEKSDISSEDKPEPGFLTKFYRRFRIYIRKWYLVELPAHRNLTFVTKTSSSSCCLPHGGSLVWPFTGRT